MQDATTADRRADAEVAAKRRDFVKKAACSRRNLGGAMDDASERVDDCGDEGTFTTPGGGATTCNFHPTSTRNKKAKTATVDSTALREAAVTAHEQREANAERRHEQTLEETRLGREQEAGFRREALDLERKRVEQGERHGAEINELRQGLTGVSVTVGQLAQNVQEQGEKQAKDLEEIKSLLRAALGGG